jgi:hypothetical protein
VGTAWSGTTGGGLNAGGVGQLLVSGDFGAEVSLTGRGVKTGPVLGTATVGGTVQGVTVSVLGSVSHFQAGQFLNSRLWVGFTPFQDGNPSADFAGSVVAAARLGTVHLKKVTADNGRTAFGFLADVTLQALTVASPAFTYNPRSTARQGFGDFVARSFRVRTTGNDFEDRCSLTRGGSPRPLPW